MNELFDLDKYSGGEVSSKKKKRYSAYTVDPAWEDGSAFPEVSSKKSSFSVGDRLRLIHTNRIGIVLDISPGGTGHLVWEGEEADSSTYDLCDCYFEKIFLEEKSESDRWNPSNFGSDPPRLVEDSGQVSIFWDSSSEPPEPDDFKTITEYEKAWEEWEQKTDESLLNTNKQRWVNGRSDLPELRSGVQVLQSEPEILQQELQVSEPDGKHLSTGSDRSISIRNDSSRSEETLWSEAKEDLQDIQTGALSVENCTKHQGQHQQTPERGTKQQLEGGTDNDAERVHSGWTDPQDDRSVWEFLEEMGQRALAKPLEESSTCTQSHSGIFLEENSTNVFSSKNHLEHESFLEENSTNAFSSKNHLEHESFLEENSTNAFSSKNHLEHESFLKQNKSKSRGCLYRYLENKKLKDGTIASYPRIDVNRDPDNPKHWRWGFNWEEKIDGEWKGRSIGSVPVGAIPMIQSMQKLGVPLEKIISFIRRSKVQK